MLCSAVSLILLVQFSTFALADLTPGVISNFQDGTVQGWDGGTVANVLNVGPLGNGDHSLRLSNGGSGGNFAMFNEGVSGVVSPSVNSITSNIFRSAGTGSAEIRLMLFDTNFNRWTSTVSANVIDNGTWHSFSFSILESDLTQVSGTGTYTELMSSLDRIMFRYDPGAPNAGGLPLSGFMYFDNITAVPEPSSMMLFVNALVLGCVLRRRR
jgi:hypothetical protein